MDILRSLTSTSTAAGGCSMGILFFCWLGRAQNVVNHSIKSACFAGFLWFLASRSAQPDVHAAGLPSPCRAVWGRGSHGGAPAFCLSIPIRLFPGFILSGAIWGCQPEGLSIAFSLRSDE